MPTSHGQLPLGKSHSPITFSTKLSHAHFCTCFPATYAAPPSLEHPRRARGCPAQHWGHSSHPIPTAEPQHHNPTALCWGRLHRVKTSPQRWQSTVAPASKTEESPIHVQCKGRTSGIFFYQTLLITPSTRAQTWLRKAATLLSRRLLGRLTEQTLLIMTGDKSFTQNQHDPGVTDARSLPRQHSPHPTKSFFWQ